MSTVFEADNLPTMLENWCNSCKVQWSEPEMSYYKSRGLNEIKMILIDHCKTLILFSDQWWANPNPDLDLNPDLATFV